MTCARWLSLIGLMLMLTVGCGKSELGNTGVSSTGNKVASTSSGKDNGGGPKTPPKKDGSGKPPENAKTPMIWKPRFLTPEYMIARDFALSPSGALLIWVTDDKIHLWDVQANKLKAEQPAEQLWDVVTFSPDSKTVALGSGGGPIKLWDVVTLKARLLRGNPPAVRGLAFVSDNRLVSGGLDKTIKVWDLGTDKEIKTIPLPDLVSHMECSADGRLATVRLHTEGHYKIWDLQTGMESTKKLPARNPEAIMVLSPDGKTLALSGSGGEVLLWDMEGGTLRKTLAGGKKTHMLGFSADGKALASVGFERVRVWDVATGNLRAVIPNLVSKATLSADGNVLVLGRVRGDGRISVWDVPPTK
jgi:WD40 repeat protein